MPRHRVSMQVSYEQLRNPERVSREGISSMGGEGNRSPLRRPLPPIVLLPEFYFRIFAFIPAFFPLPSSLFHARIFIEPIIYFGIFVYFFFLLTKLLLKLNETSERNESIFDLF